MSKRGHLKVAATWAPTILLVPLRLQYDTYNAISLPIVFLILFFMRGGAGPVAGRAASLSTEADRPEHLGGD